MNVNVFIMSIYILCILCLLGMLCLLVILLEERLTVIPETPWPMFAIFIAV